MAVLSKEINDNPDSKCCCVYAMYFNGNPIYVGSTQDLKKRIIQHHSRCYNEESNDYVHPIYSYIRSNTEWENISFKKLKVFVNPISKKKLFTFEKLYIKFFGDTILNYYEPNRTRKEYNKEVLIKNRKLCNVCNKYFSYWYINRHKRLHK